MKTFWFTITFILSACFVTSLTAQTASIMEGCVPLRVNFTAPGSSSSYFWEFGDGKTSTIQNPENVYATTGTFTVNFRESAGGPIVGNVTINVYEVPDLSFEVDTSVGCQPFVVTFTDGSTIDPNIVITGYKWVFADGNTTTTSTDNTVHTYTNTGSFQPSLELISSTEGCSTPPFFLPSSIEVSAAPVIGFVTDPNPPLACDPPLVVNFTNVSQNISGLDFEWDFGNGNTSTGAAAPSQTYTAIGNYTVTLTATDANGCTSEFVRTVTVGNPTANFGIADTLCIADEITILNLSSAGTYSWDFGPNAVPSTSTEINPTVSFPVAGRYDIKLTVTSAIGGCMGDTTISVFVDQADPTFTLDTDYSCTAPFDVSFTPSVTTPGTMYLWEFGDDSTSTESNPVHTFLDSDSRRFAKNGPDTFTVTLTLTTPSGCSAAFEQDVVLNQPEAFFVPDRVNGCAPLLVTFADSSTSNEAITNWMWFYGDGDSDTFTSSMDPSHTYQTPGTYEAFLVITNAAGCMDTSYVVTIEVGGPIGPDFTVDKTTVCPGDTVVFTDITNAGGVDIDAWHFETDNARSFHCFQDNSLSHAYFTETGSQDVTLYVEHNGCLDSITKPGLITVDGPIARIDYEVECDEPFDYTFRDSSSDATSFTWDFGDGSGPSTSSPVVHTYADTGNYEVILVAENAGNACPASSDTMTVYVRDIEAGITLETILCQGQEYQLDATPSSGAVEDCHRGYTWKFDPAINRPITTQEKMTPFIFQDTGFYNVQLIALDINGCLDTSSVRVDVLRSNVDFSMDKDTICLPATVTFTNLSTSDTTITEYNWDFGDGQTFMGPNPPPHVYNVGATTDTIITVSLMIQDAAGCGSTKTMEIYVYRPVSEIFTNPSVPAICAGEDVIFTATDFTDFGSSLTYSWDFGNGQTSTMQTFTATYNTRGDFPVVLNFEEMATGCMGSTTATVNVQEKPSASFISSLDGSMDDCAPQNVTFTDNSTTNDPPLTYLWTFNGNSQGGPSIALTLGRGTTTVNLLVSTSNGCIDTVSRDFTLRGPGGNLAVDKTAICAEGGSVTFTLENEVDVGSYSWDFGDGSPIVDNQSPVTHEYGPQTGNQIKALLILTDNSNDCTLIDSIFINVQEVTADFDFDPANICVGTNFPLVNNSSIDADVFTWDFGDGTTSNATAPSISYNDAGTYTIKLVAENSIAGCIDSITKTVTVGASPAPVITGGDICGEQSIELSVSNPVDGSTYSWIPAGNISSGGNTATVTTNVLTQTTTFTVFESKDGCTGTADFTVNVLADSPSLENDTVAVCPGTTNYIYELVQKVPGYTYSFDPVAGTDTSNLSIIADIEAGETVNYTLTATPPAGSNCSPSTATIRFESDENPVQIPNAFTPDSDELNDFFNFIVDEDQLDGTEVKRFQVFNRWGKLVYNNDDPDRGWNGYVNGNLSPSDVYIYIIEVEIAGCSVGLMKGDVTLIR